MEHSSHSFESWFRDVHPILIATLVSAFGDRELAADAAAEAFARAYGRWERVSTMSSPRAWVFRVGINEAKRILRRRAIERRLLRRGRHENETDAAPFELWSLVSHLPEPQRLTVALRHLGHLTEPEVAGILGVTRGTVSSTLRSAYKALRQELEEPRQTREESIKKDVVP